MYVTNGKKQEVCVLLFHTPLTECDCLVMDYY
jgi:hypothetical protein